MTAAMIPSIELATYASEQNGLNTQSLAYLGTVFAVASQQNLDSALDHLRKTIRSFETFFDVSSLQSLDDVISILDAGAAKVFASVEQCKHLKSVSTVDPERVILSVDALGEKELESLLRSIDGAIHIQNVQDANAIASVVAQRPQDKGPVFVSLSNLQESTLVSLCKASIIPIVPATNLTFDLNPANGLVSATNLLLANTVSDRPDGLITTLVTNERGIALGLVYSSRESVAESLKTGRGVYQSRKRGLWYKGDSSGDIQELVHVSLDCDGDCLRIAVHQKGRGFCHLATGTCFGQYQGLTRLQETLKSRRDSAPPGSYTARLFNDPGLLSAKIREEAAELSEASSKEHIAFEAADLMYFALTKCVAAGVSLEDVERSLDAKNFKVKRRKGDSKPEFLNGGAKDGHTNSKPKDGEAAASNNVKKPKAEVESSARIRMQKYVTAEETPETIAEALQRPSQKSNERIMGIVKPIIDDVRSRGDPALLEYTHKFEKATSLRAPVIHAPYDPKLMQLPPETIKAIDISFDNIWRFHAAQKEEKPLSVETMPGVVCSRFSRPIERVGLYVPGGTAVLPSTALMLGVPARVAGCKTIVLASPPRADGSLTPEIVYVAHKIGAACIVLAGGAQAVAALAHGTQSISKVDKILGPGNQFVTAAKMLVSNDTAAGVSIDMPAGPSEVLVVADAAANPAFVAADLLSQAEHGVDSQVVLIAVGMTAAQLAAVEEELHAQAMALPRVDMVRGAIEHSVILVVDDMGEAMRLANQYAPEHLILQVREAEEASKLVENAGSVFVGPWTPESVGDYSAGVNHALPTYGYARQYSGVNLGSYIKHITSSQLTQEGLRNVGGAVMQLAKVEELEAHRRAVGIRLAHMDKAS